MKTPFNVMRYANHWEMAPRMPQAVGAFILGAFGAAGAALSTATFFGVTGAYIVGYLATTAITSWAMSALAPDMPGIGGSRGLMVNVKDPAAPHEIVYGTVRKGGIRTYIESTGAENKFLHMIISLAGHELEAIDQIYVNDEVVDLDAEGFVTSGNWNSKIRIKKHLGDQTAADPDLLAESNQIDANFVGNGIAYLYVRLEYDQDAFPNGVPLFTALVRGRKVYDPRTTLTGYTANAALVVRDYLTSDFGLADGYVDELMFATSANVSDESVALAAGGSEPRYEINGVASSDMSPRTIVARMMSACGGTLFWGQGKWQLHVGYYSPPVKTFTLDDLRGPISLDTRVGARDNFNRVVGTFADKEVDYITVDFPPIESATFTTEDYGIENTLDMQLPLTTSESAAQRLAKMTLFRAREQMTLSAEFGLEAFGVQVGDVVAFTNDRYGWDEKEFEVTGWRFETSGESGDLRINLTLRETSEAAFAWNAEEKAIIHNNTALPSAFVGLAVSNLAVNGGGRTQGDGTFVSTAILTWSAAENAFLSHYVIEWKPSADSNYSSTTTTGSSIELSPIVDAVEYVFRVRAITLFDNGGPISSITYTVGGDTSAPNAPTSLSATAKARSIFLNWTNPSNLDLKTINIYQKEAATPAPVLGTDVPIASVVGQSHLIENILPLDEKFYWVTAVDFSGNESVISNMASAVSDFLQGNDLEDLTVDTIKVTDDAITSITTFNATLPYIGTAGGQDEYADFFTILEYVDDPQLRPNIFGALKYSVSGAAGASPQVRLQTQIGFFAAGGGLITLAQTQTIHTGSSNVFGEFMHNITYDSVLNVNGSGIIIARAYVQDISFATITAQGYGMARRR